MRTAGVVGGAAVPHAPQFFTLPETEDHDQVGRIRASMAGLGEDLRKLRPDVVMIVANDHLQNFMLHCVPPFTVHRGPRAQGTFAGRDFSWPIASDAATDLVRALQGQGFDPAVSMNAPIGYEFGIPLTFMGFDESIPLVPVFINSYLPPQPPADRCYQLGQAVDAAAKRLGLRIVLVASGGLSHYPGTELYSRPDLDTDRFLLDRMSAGNMRVLLELGDAGLDRTGNVEARSWLVLAGALGERRPDVVLMEPSWHHNYAVLGWSTDHTASADTQDDELHYPVPRPDQLALYEALFNLRMRPEMRREYLQDAEAYASQFELAEEERRAVVALDEERLRALGVHPLLGFLARLEVGMARAAAERTADAGN